MSAPDYRSVSQISMYLRCPKQYEFRYMQKVIAPPGIALHTGTGVHGGIEVALSQKVLRGVDLSSAEVVDAAVACFDSRLQEDGVELTKEEKSAGADAVIGRARDAVAGMADYFAIAVQPEYQPVTVEEQFSIPVPGTNIDIVGFIDVTTETMVRDFKTTMSSRRFAQADVDVDLQLTTYALAFHRRTGRRPKSVGLDILEYGEKATKRKVVSSTRSRNDSLVLLARVKEIERAIQAGIFPPCDPKNWCCSSRFCGYATRCKYFSGKE